MGRRLAAAVLFIIWGLWFGGLAALFLFAALLATTDKILFHESAPQLFNTFNRYLLILGALGAVVSALWRMRSRSKSAIVLFLLLASAAIIAALGPMTVGKKMELLRSQNLTSSPQFQSLHELSVKIYIAQALVLLAAGLVLPTAMEKR